MPHSTRPLARRLAHQFTQNLSSFIASAHPQAALYGTRSSSTLFLVAIAELSSAAKTYIGGLSVGLHSMGVTDARRFPADRGVAEACGHLTQNGTTVIVCVRRDANAVGLVEYYYGATPTSLIQVASKTNRVISASGG